MELQDEREEISEPYDEEVEAREGHSVERAEGMMAMAVGTNEETPIVQDYDSFAIAALAAKGTEWSLGPLKVRAEVDGAKVRVMVTLLGIKIASATLTTSDPELKVRADVGAAKVELKVRVDFKAKKVKVSGKVCVRVPRVGIPPWKWKCTSFSVTILKW